MIHLRSTRLSLLFCAAALLLAPSVSSLAAEGITRLQLKVIGHGSTSLSLAHNRATVVVFVALDCPMSMDYGQRIGLLDKEFAGKGVQVILVDSNRNESDAEIEKVRKALNLTIPVYRDPSASVAELLTAIVTPTAVVLDASGTIRYTGGIDDSRDPAKVKNRFVQAAVDSVLNGQPVQVPHTRVLGCSIKR